jgi:hypothetical protein
MSDRIMAVLAAIVGGSGGLLAICVLLLLSHALLGASLPVVAVLIMTTFGVLGGGFWSVRHLSH